MAVSVACKGRIVLNFKIYICKGSFKFPKGSGLIQLVSFFFFGSCLFMQFSWLIPSAALLLDGTIQCLGMFSLVVSPAYYAYAKCLNIRGGSFLQSVLAC